MSDKPLLPPRQDTIAEQIEAARLSSDAMPEWMKRVAYFATPRLKRLRAFLFLIYVGRRMNLHVVHLRNGYTVTAKYDYHVHAFAVVVRNPELHTCDKRNFQMIVPDIKELFALLEKYSAIRVDRIAGEAAT